MWLALIIGVVFLAIISSLLYIIKKLKEINDDLDILSKELEAEYERWLSNEIKTYRR